MNESERDTLVDEIDIELIDDDQPLFCWCCGYPSDDISHMVLEDGHRRKIECHLCDICQEAPWVLDSWLNPWLYHQDTKAILETIAYMSNRLVDEMRATIPDR